MGRLLLAVLVISLCSPCAAQISFSAGQGKCLASLDVCNTSGAALSVHADVPSLPELVVGMMPLACTELIKPENFLFSPSLFAIQAERPPEV
ncbi:MAG: hypothetical protein M0Z60_07830 [Nitrospiraceae bacterium]|nr:hypothetical protein [Nitrospiraceae bacterium]